MYKVIALLGLAAFGTAIPISYIQDEIDELKHEVDALKRHDVRLERRNTVKETIKAELVTFLNGDADKAEEIATHFMTQLAKKGVAARAALDMLETMVDINTLRTQNEILKKALEDAGLV